uniref:WRKY domain-containing protein n=1 Tax=Globodera rostochiensis TaxID=31243 RepID=A0A914HKA7_GLORO
MDFGNLHPVEWVRIALFRTMEEVYAYAAARGCHPCLQSELRVYFQCYRMRHHGCTYRLKAEYNEQGMIVLAKAGYHNHN